MAVVNFMRDVRLLWRYLWPFKSWKVQVNVILCMLILLLGRVVNLYSPILSKYISKLFQIFRCCFASRTCEQFS